MGPVQRPAARLVLVLMAAGGLLCAPATARVPEPGAVRAQPARSCVNTDLLPVTRAERKTAEAAVLCLVNRERTRRGLRALRPDAKLAKVAARLSDAMVAQRFFDHVTPGGRDLRARLKAVRWRGSSAGENIAWGTDDLGTPKAIVNAWMHSPGHRANILHRAFRRAGAGVTPGAPEDVGGVPAATWTMDYDAP